MAYDLSGLTSYTQEETAPFFYEMILGAKTIGLIDGAGGVYPGIKGPTKMPKIFADPTIQADSCNLTATGDDVITQFSMDVAKMAFAQTLCEKDLEPYIFRLQLKQGSNYDSVLLRNEIMEELKRRLKLKMENLLWQGDTTLTSDANLKWFNGYIKLFKNDVNVVVATPSPKIALATVGNARVGLQTLYKAIPLEVINDPDTLIFTGMDVVRSYQMDLTAANLFNISGEVKEVGDIAFENTAMKIVGVPGLNAKKFAVAVNLRNLAVPTDLANEEERIDIEPVANKKSLFLIQAAWKLGASYAFGAEVTIYEWS